MKISSLGWFFFFICFFITIVLSAPAPAAPGGEVEDETEFSYDPNAENGPQNWGTIKEEWKLCGTGKMQSPIALNDQNVIITNRLGPLISNYLPSYATLVDRGHDIMLRFEGGNRGLGIIINGIRYKLQQLHWHTPSEHTINGIRFVLEEHLVHESEDGRIAVVGLLYRLGGPDPLLLSLEKQLKKLKDTDSHEEPVGVVDPRNINFVLREYYRYSGSLTTPPCSENVTWTVSKQIRTVTSNQVELLRTAVHDDANSNARPLQPLNNRVVYLYKPRFNFMINNTTSFY